MTTNNGRQQGFTLIELMIVVAIIAVLAALALPAYQSLVGRAQLTEAIAIASGAKLAVTENFRPISGLPVDNAAAGLRTPTSITSQFVKSVTVTNGQISVKLSANIHQAMRGKHLLLMPSIHGENLRWTCSSTDIDRRYLPASCR